MQGFTGTHVVAKCTGCFYELDYKQVELDVVQSGQSQYGSTTSSPATNRLSPDQGNFTTHGIGFRIRFLQKSHVATKRIDENLYACLFCAM